MDKIYSIGELVNRALENEIAWRNYPCPSIGDVVVNRESGCVEIETGTMSFPYQIDLARLQTKDQILNWIFHLQCKSWITPALMYDFLSALRNELAPELLFDWK